MVEVPPQEHVSADAAVTAQSERTENTTVATPAFAAPVMTLAFDLLRRRLRGGVVHPLHLSETEDVHLAPTELAGDEDDVLELELRVGVLLEERRVPVVDDHLGGQVDVLASVPRFAEEEEEASVGIEELDVLEARVHHVEAPLTVHRHALGPGELAGAGPDRAVAPDERAAEGELLDAEVHRVGDVEVVVGAHRHVGRIEQVARRGADLAELEDEVPGRLVEHLDLVVLEVGHVEPAADDRHVSGLELALGAVGPDELVLSVEDEDLVSADVGDVLAAVGVDRKS